eukprot:gene2476-3219_t
MPVRDATAGFKCYRRRVLETVDLDRIKFKGYAFQIEMKFVAWKLGFKLKEVPIIFTERLEGTSKMSGSIIREAALGATIINEGKRTIADVRIRNSFIETISPEALEPESGETIINATGKYLIPGAIDDQVHFREPGLTHKADIYTESRAAVAGGITSFMEMPNTNPQTLTQELLAQKYQIGSEKSLANYSFFMGASNDNLAEVLKTDPKTVCGVKVFMGSSTGNMLVDDQQTLD